MFHSIGLLIVLFGTINIIRMATFLVGSDIYGVIQEYRKKRKKEGYLYYPSVSIVIPAYNEQSTIARGLASVCASDYPIDRFEVIVIDDGSSDDTVGQAKLYADAHPEFTISIQTQKNAGKAKALNNGMKNYAKGSLIMCLDADSYIDKNALRNMVKYFEDDRVDALAANVKIVPTGSLLNLIQRFEYIICYQMKRAQTVGNIEYIIGGIGSCFRKRSLKRVGYYDTNTITEDIDLTMKFISDGNIHQRVIYGSDVIAYTESVLSVSDLIKQRFRWKWGRSQTFLKHSHMFFNSNPLFSKKLTWFYLPFAFYGDIAFFFEPVLVAYILYIIVRYQDLVTLFSAAAVISIYIIMNVIAEDTISWHEKIILVFMAPAMYALFYLLSFVEYVALIKALWQVSRLKKSISDSICHWQHVQRRASVQRLAS